MNIGQHMFIDYYSIEHVPSRTCAFTGKVRPAYWRLHGVDGPYSHDGFETKLLALRALAVELDCNVKRTSEALTKVHDIIKELEK
jgi:hypothetical protein